jgi:fimbrial isopeptide formation D2 family protein/LPXTG-motif cell wall-anchored protein
MKKVLSLILVVALIAAMAIPAMADPGIPSITINPNNDETNTASLSITYTYYKILSADIDTDPAVGDDGNTTTDGVAAYYVEDAAQATALRETGVFTVTQVPGQNKWYVELADGKGIDDIITAFDNDTFLANFTKLEYTKPAGTDSAVLPDITAGYYFIKSSLGTKVAIQTLSPVTINEKNSYPGVTKTEADTDALAGIGDTITYTITVNIPESVASKPIKVVDTITDGLTLNTSVTVSGAVADPAYTSATFVATDTKGVYNLVIPADVVIANKGKTLTFTYTATVNENAVVLQPETNTAHLEYDGFVTVETETVSTKTLAFTLEKVDGTDHNAGTITELAGAEFSLWDAATDGNKINLVKVSDGVYRVATAEEAAVDGFESAVIEAATATINGLNDATYYLQEDKAPTGYNKLEGRVSVSVTEETSVEGVDTYVDNNKGATLPSTGGHGVYWFYGIGGALIVGAVVLLITKKRMSKEQ